MGGGKGRKDVNHLFSINSSITFLLCRKPISVLENKIFTSRIYFENNNLYVT